MDRLALTKRQVGSGNEIDLRPMKFRDDRARPSDQKVNYTIKEQLRDLFFVATPAPGVRLSKDPKTFRARKLSRKSPETTLACFSKRTIISGVRSRHFFP